MELKGEGFILRKIRRSDAPALQRLADNPKIAANLYNRFPSPYSIADAEFFINLIIDRQPIQNFVIDVAGEFAGLIGIDHREDVFAKSPLFGYWLGETYWGRGIMTEAVLLVMQYTFETFDVICLQAGVFGGNPASMRVLEKAGFKKQGVLKGVLIKNGTVMDEHIYIACPPQDQ